MMLWVCGVASGYGIKVPPGFAITAESYWHFIEANDLGQWIASQLAELKKGKISVAELGSVIRAAIEKGDWPEDLERPIRQAYRDLSQRLGVDQPDVALRSSATAEDPPEASFAGQHESFLNVRGEAGQALKAGAKVGLCGQAPSNRPDFAEFLVDCGIESISVTHDSFIAVKQHVTDAELAGTALDADQGQ